MIALSQGRPTEPPVQAPVRNPDPLGRFPNFSLFAGPIMVPQQTEVPVTPTQQIEVPASRSPVVLTPVPDANRTRTPPVDEVPVIIFYGDNRTCTICQKELEDGERVVRLRCRHIFHAECWMSATVNHGAPLDGDDDPDCPNCRGQGTIIALWNYIDANQVAQPGAANLWTGDNTRLDLMPDLDNDLPDLVPPDEPDTGLINHGQSNPEQLVETDPRQALKEAHAEQTTNRGRRNIAVHHQTETPTNSRAESAWGTQDSQNSRSIRPGRHSSSSYPAVPRSRSASAHRPRDLPPSSFIVLPSTYLDANEWSMQERTPSALINHGEVDRQDVYHSETRLPEGRPSLLIDPGSVANLRGDK